MFNKTTPVILLTMLFLLAACGRATVSVGPVVPVGQPTPIDLPPIEERVWNCGEGGGQVVKHPQMGVLTGHAVEWEVGGQAGVGLTVGEGVIPGGVNLSGSLEGHYVTKFDQSVERSTAWDLPAEPDTEVVYTVVWRELWQPGYVDVHLPGQSPIRVNLRYRTGIQSDIVGKDVRICKEEQTVVPRVTSTLSPTATPTATPPPKERGWHLYDDFTAPDALETNWWLNDENQICTLNVSEGQLSFDCSNKTADDLGAALHPSHPSDTLMGIAVTVSVESTGGPFQLVTSWQCDADGLQRDYHLELDTDAVRATEFYPQENWRMVLLGEVAVTPNEAHVLQMERTSDSIEFFVDSQPLPLDTLPELPACFSTNYWSFDFWVWQDGNRLKGQIDQVSVRATDAPVSPSPTGTCDASALSQRGWDLIDLGTQNCQGAWEKMNEAVLCNPEHAEMWYGRGSVSFQCGAYTEAVNDFTEAIKRNDRNPLYYEMRALTYMRLGDAASYESCVQDFIHVLKLAPNNVTALDDKAECQRAISPFFDDFETETINLSMWDTSEAQNVSIREGHLCFDVPLNDSGGWVEHQIKAKPSGSSISRIMFTVGLDTPPRSDLGWLILGTSCSASPGWMGAYAGGPEGKFVVQYAPQGDNEGDKIYFESVADGQNHTIELRWTGDHVQVYIDGQLQDENIPCQGPAYYAYFGAGLNPGTQVSGCFDDISIWP